MFGIAAVLGWCFSIFFLNGFRPTALFSVMVVRLLFRDFLVFGLCYFFISCGFAAAIAANMNYRSNPPFPYSDWKFTFFTLFWVILVLMDIEYDPKYMFDGMEDAHMCPGDIRIKQVANKTENEQKKAIKLR